MSSPEIWWIDPHTKTEHHVTRLSWSTKKPGEDWKLQKTTPQMVDLYRRILGAQ